MTLKSILVPALAGTLSLGGCHANTDSATIAASVREAGVVTVAADLSGSTPFMASPAYANAAVKRVGDVVLKQRIGDRFRIVPIGDRNVANAVDTFSMASGQKMHLRTVRMRMEVALSGLFAEQRRHGGNRSTNILYGLQNSHPVCNPHSTIYVLTDGFEASSEANVGAALTSGRPVTLPNPSQPFLKGGCTIWMIGIGVSSLTGRAKNVQTLPDAQLQALTNAWRTWFVSAGAAPANVHFETIL